jgi:hypothetical protein
MQGSEHVSLLRYAYISYLVEWQGASCFNILLDVILIYFLMFPKNVSLAFISSLCKEYVFLVSQNECVLLPPITSALPQLTEGSFVTCQAGSEGI